MGGGGLGGGGSAGSRRAALKGLRNAKPSIAPLKRGAAGPAANYARRRARASPRRRPRLRPVAGGRGVGRRGPVPRGAAAGGDGRGAAGGALPAGAGGAGAGGDLRLPAVQDQRQVGRAPFALPRRGREALCVRGPTHRTSSSGGGSSSQTARHQQWNGGPTTASSSAGRLNKPHLRRAAQFEAPQFIPVPAPAGPPPAGRARCPPPARTPTLCFASRCPSAPAPARTSACCRGWRRCARATTEGRGA